MDWHLEPDHGTDRACPGPGRVDHPTGADRAAVGGDLPVAGHPFQAGDVGAAQAAGTAVPGQLEDVVGGGQRVDLALQRRQFGADAGAPRAPAPACAARRRPRISASRPWRRSSAALARRKARPAAVSATIRPPVIRISKACRQAAASSCQRRSPRGRAAGSPRPARRRPAPWRRNRTTGAGRAGCRRWRPRPGGWRRRARPAGCPGRRGQARSARQAPTTPPPITTTSAASVPNGGRATGRARSGEAARRWPPHSGFSIASAAAGNGLAGRRGAKASSTVRARPVSRASRCAATGVQ